MSRKTPRNPSRFRLLIRNGVFTGYSLPYQTPTPNTPTGHAAVTRRSRGGHAAVTPIAHDGGRPDNRRAPSSSVGAAAR